MMANTMHYQEAIADILESKVPILSSKKKLKMYLWWGLGEFGATYPLAAFATCEEDARKYLMQQSEMEEARRKDSTRTFFNKEDQKAILNDRLRTLSRLFDTDRGFLEEKPDKVIDILEGAIDFKRH